MTVSDSAAQDSRNLNRRLGHLESEVAGIGTKVDSLEKGLERVVSAVEGLSQQVGSAGRTDWKTIFAGAAILMSIGTLALAPMYKRMDEQKYSTRKQWDIIRNHVAEEGHAPMRIRVGSVEDDVKHLDEILQREMRILYDAVKKDIEHVHSTLQREMDLKDKAVLAGLKALIARVTKIENEQARRTSRVYTPKP